jgi:hypothetical protein
MAHIKPNLLVRSKDQAKTKYMCLFRQQNAGKSHDIKIAKTSFEIVAQLKYFGNDSNK